MDRRKLHFVIAVSIATSLALSSTALQADVLAHWAFDELNGSTAFDSVGGYHGTLQGNAAFVPAGVAGGAISLDRGTNDLVNMGDVLALWQGGDFSIAAWVSTTSPDPETFVVAKHQSLEGAGYILGINTSGGYLGGPGKAWFYNNFDSAISTTTVTDGLWHHLVGVHHADGPKEIHVDGAPAEDSTPSDAVRPNTAPLLIGGLSYGGVPTGCYTGLIDDVQVYDHALTPDEVQFLFDNPGNPIPSVPWVSPARVENSGPWRLAVLGGTFEPQSGATLTLTPSAGGSQIVGTDVSLDDGRLTATFDLTDAPVGDYDLVVTNPDTSSATAPRALSVMEAQPPLITRMNPALGGNTGTVTVAITGEHLNPFAEVKLSRSGWQDILAQTISGFGDGTELTVRFDLQGAAPGEWDVVATNPNEDSGGATDTFTVERGGGPQMSVQITGPQTVRLGRSAAYQVAVGNFGLRDAEVAFLQLRLPAGWRLERVMDDVGSEVALAEAELTPDAAPLLIALPGCHTAEQRSITVLVTPGAPGGPSGGGNGSPRFVISGPVIVGILSAVTLAECIDLILDVIESVCGNPYPGFIPDVEQGVYNHFGEWFDEPVHKALVLFLTGLFQGLYDGGIITQEMLNLLNNFLDILDNLFGLVDELEGAAEDRAVRSLEPRLVTSWDPNYKAGPAGFGEDHYVPRDQPLGYIVHFENDPE